jgi:hypothetical protein
MKGLILFLSSEFIWILGLLFSTYISLNDDVFGNLLRAARCVLYIHLSQFKLKSFSITAFGIVQGILTWLVYWVDISQRDCLFLCFGLSFKIFDSPQILVQVAGTEDVSSIEYINSSVSRKIIDIKGKFNCCYFLLYETKFL